LVSWGWDYLVILAWLALVFLVIGLPQMLGWMDLSAIWENQVTADIATSILTVLPYFLYLTLTENSPASPDRARIVPATGAATANERGEAAADRQRAMSWAQRLRRVFAIDIETCRQCGGKLRVIASIEAPAVIERILEHLGRDAGSVDSAHPGRAPPARDTSL